MSTHLFTPGVCRRASAVLFLFLLVQASPSFGIDLARKVEFSVPPQSLATAVIQFSKQADLQVLASGQKIDGVASKGLQGRYAIDEGLKTLLEGTGFGFKVVGDNTISLTPANAGPTGNVAPQVSKLESISVTGTYIRTVEPFSPLITITKDDLLRQGYTRLDQALEQLPQNFQQGVSARSNATNGASDNQTFSSGVNLRGLGPGTTLILLNGRRLAPTGLGSTTDISSIPVSIIERVEILMDGASAIYGSDAIGGVVNIITKKDYAGYEIGARAGDISKGKSPSLGGNVLGGLDWNGGNLIVNLDYEKDRPLLASKRSFSSSAPDPTLLTPDMKASSLYSSLEQRVSNQLTFSSDVILSKRDWVFDNAYFSTLAMNSGNAKQVAGSAQLEYVFPTDWKAMVVGQVSRESDFNVRGFADTPATNNVDAYDYRVRSIEARADGGLFDLRAGRVRAAFGASQRWESFDSDNEVTGNSPSQIVRNQTRDVRSAYGELVVPLIGASHNIPFMERLAVDVAVRHDRYSDFGATTNPKVSAKWVLKDGFSLGGTYSQSYKAPRLYLLNPNATNVGYVFAAPDPRSQTGSTTVLVLDGTNPNLGPEKAKTISIGASYEPTRMPGTKFSASYFDVNYRDKIERLIDDIGLIDVLNRADEVGRFLHASPTISEVQSQLNSPGRRLLNFLGRSYTAQDIQAIAFLGYQNAASSRVRGYDVSARHEVKSGLGTFSADGAATYYTSYKNRFSSGATEFSNIATVFNPPRWRSKLNLGWGDKGFQANVRANFTGAEHNPLNANLTKCTVPPGCEVAAWTTVDVGASYSGENFTAAVKDWKVGVFVTNLFNRSPPFVLLPSQVNYDPVNASPLGRAFAFTVTKRF